MAPCGEPRACHPRLHAAQALALRVAGAGSKTGPMLCITVHRHAAAAAAYYTSGLSRAAYYTAAPLPGVWQGKGAALLGLAGAVTATQFLALCENQHPGTGERLTVRTKANRRAGYDLTFNAPKSLTLGFQA